MRDLAKQFLTEQEQQRINAAVEAAEKTTSGEIVCLVESASYRYPMANVLGGTVLALPLSLVLTPLIGGWLPRELPTTSGRNTILQEQDPADAVP